MKKGKGDSSGNINKHHHQYESDRNRISCKKDLIPVSYTHLDVYKRQVLLLLRQALDFSYKEELVMASLADYVEQVRTWVEEVPVAEKPDPDVYKRQYQDNFIEHIEFDYLEIQVIEED